MAEHEHILMIEDDAAFAERMHKNLELEGFKVDIAHTGTVGLQKLRQRFYDLAIVDIKLPDADGIEILRKLKGKTEPDIDPDMPVVMLTSVNDVTIAVEAMRLGAADYITKESERREIIIRLLRVIEQNRLLNENRLLRDQLARATEFGEIIGTSEVIRKIKKDIVEVARLDVPVLIIGETGVGKELVAHAIHRTSQFREGPFIDLNCAALPEDNLFQSELFGHEKGAFTNAHAMRRGKFEIAHNGTIFFDEISELTLDSQAKLLRVIESFEFSRIGGNRPIKVRCRLILATNRNLESMVREGTFRNDLYFRISVFPVIIPPLRERPEDITALSLFFLNHYCEKYNRPLVHISPAALEDLQKYPWYGNVRELKNIIERLVIRSRSREIDIDDIKQCGIQVDETIAAQSPMQDIPDEGINIDDVERQLVVGALEKANWNQKEAARLLGISIDRMHNRIRKYGITHPSWRVNR